LIKFKIINFIALEGHSSERRGSGSFVAGCGDYRGASGIDVSFLRRRNKEKWKRGSFSSWKG
jgi:hypothetical protein